MEGMPALTPVDISFAETASRRIEVEHRIKAPASEIWEVITNNSTWTDWFDGMTSCETTSEVAHGVGASRRVNVGPMELDEEFIVWEENERWAFTVTNTSLALAKRMLEMIELQDVGTKAKPETLVTYTGAFQPHILTFLPFPLFKLQLKRTWKKAFENLDEYVTKK